MFQSHAAEDDYKKRTRKDEDSCEEYVLISALTGSISHGSDT